MNKPACLLSPVGKASRIVTEDVDNQEEKKVVLEFLNEANATLLRMNVIKKGLKSNCDDV